METFQGKLEQTKMSDNIGRPKSNELKAQTRVKQTSTFQSMKNLKAIFFLSSQLCLWFQWHRIWLCYLAGFCPHLLEIQTLTSSVRNSLLRPKSVSTTWPSESRRIFSSFISRYIIPNYKENKSISKSM